MPSLAGLAWVACLVLRPANAQERASGVEAGLLKHGVQSYSVDGGETFAAEPPPIAPGEVLQVTVRQTFSVPETAWRMIGAGVFVSLTYQQDVAGTLRAMALILNDREVALPLEGMVYRSVPGIDPRRLRQGENTLVAKLAVRNPSRREALQFSAATSLAPLTPRDLAFQTGPLLGAFGENYFTVTCRMNMPARVSVYRGKGAGEPGGMEDSDRVATSEGLIHRLRVPRGSGEGVSYWVVAERDGFQVSEAIRAPELPKRGLTFLVIGDTRTNVRVWREMAALAVEGEADLTVHLGDFVTHGPRDWEWDTEFWHPGRTLLSRMPLYPVIGNHEANAPLYDELFFTPSHGGRSHNWAQEMNGVLLVGIDGGQDWSPGSENASWLERALSASGSRFKFVFAHYPAWSSAAHGRVDDAGAPAERPAREARQTVLPILGRHRVTAFVAGHDHVYERSELPDGLTAVTCGGGGAGLYEKTAEAPRQNPYSVLFSSQHHICLFRVTDDSVTLQAFGRQGERIDERTWRTSR